MASPIRRGDVWMVDLKPQTHPEEPSKERPCLVVQASQINDVHQTIIVIPISSSAEASSYPTDDPIRVHIGSFARDKSGPAEHSWALVDCVRSVSKKRFTREARVYSCPTAALKKVEKSLRLFLAL